MLAGIAVRLSGLLFKIPLVNIMGDEGMGYFNSAYTVYTFFFTVSTSGLPLALSMLISECDVRSEHSKKLSLFKNSLKIFTFAGIVLSLLMYFGGDAISSLIGNKGASDSIRAISPVIFFVCITSVIRGYYQGHMQMSPTALSQLIEAIGKLIIGISLSYYAMKTGCGPKKISQMAIIGVTLSEGLSMLYLLMISREKRRGVISDGCGLKTKTVITRILAIAAPLTLASSIMSIEGILELSTVMRSLKHLGLTETAANSLYGNYTGLALPIFNLPVSLITPIAISVVPYITSCLANGEKKLSGSIAASAVRSSLIITVPCTAGLLAFSKQILNLLFSSERSELASPLLKILSVSIIFVGLTTVTSSLLQAYKKRYLPIISMLIGCAVKLPTSYFLVRKLGMPGAPISTLCCYFTAAACNLIFLSSSKGLPKIRFGLLRVLIKPILSAIVSIGSAYCLYSLCLGRIPEKLATVAACIISALLYAVMLILLRTFTKHDLPVFPGGKYIEKIMIK